MKTTSSSTCIVILEVVYFKVFMLTAYFKHKSYLNGT